MPFKIFSFEVGKNSEQVFTTTGLTDKHSEVDEIAGNFTSRRKDQSQRYRSNKWEPKTKVPKIHEIKFCLTIYFSLKLKRCFEWDKTYIINRMVENSRMCMNSQISLVRYSVMRNLRFEGTHVYIVLANFKMFACYVLVCDSQFAV